MTDCSCIRDSTILTETVSATCNANGSWSIQPPICYSRCKIPPPIGGSLEDMFVVGSYVDHGFNLTLKCDQGMVMEGEGILCYNGTWMSTVGCVKSTNSCDEVRPPELKDGYFKYHGTQHGETAKYFCYSGYRLEGPDTVTCYDGVWLGDMENTTCVLKLCEYPGTLENGDILLIGIKGQFTYRNYVKKVKQYDQIEYRCRKDFTLEGPEGSTCVDGVWSPKTIPTCQPRRHLQPAFERYRGIVPEQLTNETDIFYADATEVNSEKNIAVSLCDHTQQFNKSKRLTTRVKPLKVGCILLKTLKKLLARTKSPIHSNGGEVTNGFKDTNQTSPISIVDNINEHQHRDVDDKIVSNSNSGDYNKQHIVYTMKQLSDSRDNTSNPTSKCIAKCQLNGHSYAVVELTFNESLCHCINELHDVMMTSGCAAGGKRGEGGESGHNDGRDQRIVILNVYSACSQNRWGDKCERKCYCLLSPSSSSPSLSNADKNGFVDEDEDIETCRVLQAGVAFNKTMPNIYFIQHTRFKKVLVVLASVSLLILVFNITVYVQSRYVFLRKQEDREDYNREMGIILSDISKNYKQQVLKWSAVNPTPPNTATKETSAP
ncbi:hypothetical protein HELRODRAFT_189328 [Helobdella robusta]|uniref:Sushi domain-containing protein n=1 Tax=Helobdella robusta TaxID=6412 RepID=T1FQY7_HELRO|nr:hypothetical protein HELRODRAFT_189328 [Helobdella robusta]ESN96658.1 hypothetical protein HELRODRAFT_189328 [Helobdella robusta]